MQPTDFRVRSVFVSDGHGGREEERAWHRTRSQGLVGRSQENRHAIKGRPGPDRTRQRGGYGPCWRGIPEGFLGKLWSHCGAVTVVTCRAARPEVA